LVGFVAHGEEAKEEYDSVPTNYRLLLRIRE
jgi:hypothetical protein